MDGVHKVIADQCRYGPQSNDKDGEGPARNAIGFTTNSPCIVAQLQRRCPDRGGYNDHKHITLQGGRARAAQVYPQGFCQAACRGLLRQIEVDRGGKFLIINVEYDETQSSRDIMNMAKKVGREPRAVGEENDVELEFAWDDVSGAELIPTMVKQAREEAIKYLRNIELDEKVPVTQCYEKLVKHTPPCCGLT